MDSDNLLIRFTGPAIIEFVSFGSDYTEWTDRIQQDMLEHQLVPIFIEIIYYKPIQEAYFCLSL